MKLRELREKRSFSQRELAERSRVTHQTIYRLENVPEGKANAHPRTRRKLAEALGVGPSELA
jgi:transcriptional regulator with XRE-family HTH domain